MKLLHAADFHMDSPFQRLDVEQAMARRRDLREVPARLAGLARREGVDLALLPGDLFDGERVYPETVRALREALASMGCPVVIAPGNHDHLRPGSPYLSEDWPDNVHIFTDTGIGEFQFPALNCVVHGCAFTAPHREDDPLAGWSAPADGKLHLLCLHGEVGGAGRYAPISPDSLAGSGADYAALGHVHACSGLCRAGRVTWAYPGCPEGRGFDECGDKGCLLVELTKPAGVSAHFVPICTRRYRIESVNMQGFTEALPDEVSPDLVRILLAGESETPPDLSALTAQAVSHYFYAEVQDRTTLPQDLWARQKEDSLTGLFLREMRRRLDETADEAGRESVLLAVRFGLAALEGGEDICP